LYKCVTGSGIGLLHSAHLSNAFFFSRVERHLVLPKLYIRYHDDIFVLCRSYCEIRSLVQRIRFFSSPVFTITCSGIAPTGAQLTYLDLNVLNAVPRLGVQCCQDKPALPLCPTSAHVPHVHRSWPTSMCKRVVSLSDSPAQACDQLLSRYKLANAHPFTLNLLDDAISSSLSLESFIRASDVPPSIFRRETFVCRYHPSLRVIMNRAIKAVPPPKELGIILMPAWRNFLPSLKSKLDKRFVCREGRREGALCVSHNTLSMPLQYYTCKL
jgi:hypothetical protein